jgi:hypothetical protein
MILTSSSYMEVTNRYPGGKALSSVLAGLAVNEKLIIIGASDEPIEHIQDVKFCHIRFSAETRFLELYCVTSLDTKSE